MTDLRWQNKAITRITEGLRKKDYSRMPWYSTVNIRWFRGKRKWIEFSRQYVNTDCGFLNDCKGRIRLREDMDQCHLHGKNDQEDWILPLVKSKWVPGGMNNFSNFGFIYPYFPSWNIFFIELMGTHLLTEIRSYCRAFLTASSL